MRASEELKQRAAAGMFLGCLLLLLGIALIGAGFWLVAQPELIVKAAAVLVFYGAMLCLEHCCLVFRRTG